MWKVINKVIFIAVFYIMGVFSGIAFLIYPIFDRPKPAYIKTIQDTSADTARFRFNGSNLIIYKDTIAEASLSVMEIEFKKDGRIVKKGTNETIGKLVLKKKNMAGHVLDNLANMW